MARIARPAAALGKYRDKRDFLRTPEPEGASPSPHERPGGEPALAFVVQKHRARRLHYDLRLEIGGVLASWAVPKGPSFDPHEKRMAIHVEDHPLDYGGFEGTIPPGAYGAGDVIVWDRGTWEPVGDARRGLEDGKLVFRLHGEKLAGLWELVRIAKPGDRQDRWMLFKKRDAWARPMSEYDVVCALPDSVVAAPLGLVEEREPREPREPRDARAPAGRAGPQEPDLARARKAALPSRLEPQLAMSAAKPPSGDGWIVETKFDGYRVLARVSEGKARLFTRGGHDWTGRIGALAQCVERLGVDSAWLDGEIVVLDANGVPDFSLLQNAIDTKRGRGIEYFLFDVPYLDGVDLRRVPLASRRIVLRRLLERNAPEGLRLSQSFDAPPAQVLAAACAMKLEGVVCKRADAPYVSARTESWLKLKCSLRQEFVVTGYTERSGASGDIGALLLAFHENGQLHDVGRVGTGWNSKTGQALRERLERIAAEAPPGDLQPAPARRSRHASELVHWVRPELVVEVSFSDWTPAGCIRRSTFRGIRDDKPAGEVTREATIAAQSLQPSPSLSPSSSSSSSSSPAPRGSSSVRVTHPERVVDASTGLRKLDLVRYYESVASWMLPHLRGRPVTLVRAPEGIGGELFFQKHAQTPIPGLTELDASLWPGHPALLAVDSVQALVAAAQMNVVEFHTWNSTVRHIDEPDRIVFDLDPGESVAWDRVREAAMLMRVMLEELGLRGWLKTSGGKGLHVVVPLAPKLDSAIVKGFSHAVVRHMARTIPQWFVSKPGVANRIGRIFIDYLRNGHAQTTVAAFSARARPGLAVSMPIEWDELRALENPAKWNIATAREYLSFREHDPWSGYWNSRQTLAAAMKRLGFDAKKT